VAGQKLP
jgi:hypothetical protein